MKKMWYLVFALVILVSCSNESSNSKENVEKTNEEDLVTVTDSTISASGNSSSDSEKGKNENNSNDNPSSSETESTNQSSSNSNSNKSVQKPTKEEVEALADQLLAKYHSSLNPQYKQQQIEFVGKVNIIPDEYPEILLLDQIGGKSEINVFRYITEHKLYPSVKNEWVSIYRNVDHDNKNGDEPLKIFANMQFKEGLDYPVIGYHARGSFLNFFILGSDEREQIAPVFDSMGEDIPAGELVIDLLVGQKIDVMMRGEIEYTITADDIK